jgi:hypothetical protein
MSQVSLCRFKKGVYIKEIKLKRLWNNLASLRDYDVKRYIEEGITVKLTVVGRNDHMILTPDKMKQKSFQAVGDKFNSKFVSGMKYTLIDFAWKPES